MALLVDLGSLLYSSVVLPEDEHCVRVLSELRLESERSTVLVCKYRSRTCSIESDTDHILGCTCRTCCESLLYRAFEYLDIIKRMLTPLVC